MSLESSSARAEQMARQLLIHGRVVPADELIAKVDDVTAEHVRDVRAQARRERPSIVVVGSGKKSLKYARQAESMAHH